MADAAKHRTVFKLTSHGIFKGLGAGGVCALLSTEDKLQTWAKHSMKEAGFEMRKPIVSFDSVNFLPPTITEDDEIPRWIHRDVRLSKANDGVQTIVNLMEGPMEGSKGDASFTCVARTHTKSFTEAELLAQGADPSKVKRAFAHDFVMLARLHPGPQPTAASPRQSILWEEGMEPTFADIPCGGALAWHSTLYHCGSLFRAPGRPLPRIAKYVCYRDVKDVASTIRIRHMKEMLGIDPTRKRPRQSFFNPSAAGEELKPVEKENLKELPLAYTTPHKGGRKNNSGLIPTFRVPMKQRLEYERINKILQEGGSVFFSLPYLIARAGAIQFEDVRQWMQQQEKNLLDLALEVWRALRVGVVRGIGSMPDKVTGSKAFADKLRSFVELH